MTTLPAPVALPMPPGDPGALADVAGAGAGAAFRLGELEARLGDLRSSAPGWLGADASAAASQIDTAALLVRHCHDAVTEAIDRLAEHGDRLLEARRRVAGLRRAQEDDFRTAVANLWRFTDVAAAMSSATPEPAAVAVVDDLLAAEAARSREHARVLDEIADDAAATAAVLAASAAVVGGTGARGDADRVLVRLALALPGWGDAELAARGAALARALAAAPDVPADSERLVRDVAAFAGTAAFAGALLTGLGTAGVRRLLEALGRWELVPTGAVARLLAAAFGAAVSGGGRHDPVGDVVRATYVDADDRTDAPDVIAMGLAAVLRAGRHGWGSVRPETVAGWARQALAREATLGVPAVRRVLPMEPEGGPADLVAGAVSLLAAEGHPSPAAALLGDRASWGALLARSWQDGGAALGRLVGLASAEPGPEGRAAVRSGLEALGAGLSDGNPEDWTVDRETAAAVARPLATGVAAHLVVATDALGAGIGGAMGPGDGDVLRGLGYLTLDRTAAAAVEHSLRTWALAQSLPPSVGAGPPVPLTAVAVTGAYLAVQEYGQRLAYALHGFEEQAAAERRELWWNATVGVLCLVLTRGPGVVLGVAEPWAARWLGMDGTWENGPDRGLVFGPRDAIEAALADAPPDRAALAAEAARQAAAGFRRTAQTLGLPRPPVSPESEWWEPLLDSLPGPDLRGRSGRRSGE